MARSGWRPILNLGLHRLLVDSADLKPCKHIQPFQLPPNKFANRQLTGDSQKICLETEKVVTEFCQ